MADANPSGEPVTNPTGSDEPAGEPNTNEPGSSNQPKGPSEAERKLQSDRDKLRERVAELEGYAVEGMREKAVNSFLKENKSKFPDVALEDFAFAESPEQFEEIAKKQQDRMDRVKLKAIEDVHKPQDDSLTDEQVEKEVSKLEKEPPKNAFQQFLSLQQRRKR